MHVFRKNLIFRPKTGNYFKIRCFIKIDYISFFTSKTHNYLSVKELFCIFATG